MGERDSLHSGLLMQSRGRGSSIVGKHWSTKQIRMRRFVGGKRVLMISQIC